MHTCLRSCQLTLPYETVSMRVFLVVQKSNVTIQIE